MELSTSLNVLVARPVEEAIARCAAAGFRAFDFNYCDYVRPWLLGVTWNEEEAWAHAVRGYAEREGVRLEQMHGPIFNPLDGGAGVEELIALSERSVRTAAILGVRWVVFHPATSAGAFNVAHRRELREANIGFVRRLLEVGEGGGVGVALENCQDGPPAAPRARRQYGAVPEELVEVVDALGTERAGVCWDTGHGEVQGLDQGAALRALGSRLKVTHVHDNDGRGDRHLLPGEGVVDWGAIGGAMVEMGYEGTFSLEVQGSFRNVADGERDGLIGRAYAAGRAVMPGGVRRSAG